MDSLYLILGSEGALADSALLKLTTQLKEESAELTTLSASEVIVGDIADALAPSLFSERRALVIKELQDLPEDSRDEITRYLDNTDPTTTVIFMHKGGVKGKALLDAIKKAKATIIACEPLKKESEKQEFVRNLFLDLGRKASPAAVSALVNAVGGDLRELSAACSQIVSDTPAGTIDEAHVEKFHQGRIETTGFDVADIALDGNLAQALITLRSAIASAIRGLAKVSGANRNVKSFELAGSLAMAPWQIDKARRQLAGWTPKGLIAAVSAVAQADADVKGAASDPIYALEKAISEIATARNGRPISV
jgi:DNA polymerase-3 subunit delta